MFEIGVRRHFDAAHFLEGYEGPCASLHGHRWTVEVVIQFAGLPCDGMAKDFKNVKDVIDQMLPDHRCLNECYTFKPTAENLAHFFHRFLCGAAEPLDFVLGYKPDMLMGRYWDIVSVTVWESSDCWARYREDEDGLAR